MKVDKELKIKKKYFDAILQLNKPFELRHDYIEPSSIIKLECVEDNRYIIFKSGPCVKLNEYDTHKWNAVANFNSYSFNAFDAYQDNGPVFHWYDNFVYKYIKDKTTYLIMINEIIEVK